MFAQDYVGGAELTSEAIIEDSFMPVHKVHSQNVTIQLMETHSDKYWIFGNFSNVNQHCIVYAIKNLNYSVLEYDYKFCKFRSPEKHKAAEGICDCEKQKNGKLVSVFYANSKSLWFMSEKQKNVYCNRFPFLNTKKTRVLSSVFSKKTLELISQMQLATKEDKWIILNSNSWVKGKNNAIAFAEKNNLKYELVWNLKHKELLEKLSQSRGLIYLPAGADTCPRLTIEAKLLDCQLVLNEYVQHKDEEWFQKKDTTLTYLKERTKVFWSTVEKDWNLETPNYHDGNDTKFNIIVPFWNASSWLKKCITSIKDQNYQNYECFFIDDMSTDNSSDIVTRAIEGDNKFHLIKNTTKKFALGNIVDALNTKNSSKHDVNIILDGDDWFSSYNVLSYLNKIYTESDCLMTYGSYVYYPNGTKGVEPSPYPEEVIKNNSFRSDNWRASHLRTFKTLLWHEIDLDDLRDSTGHFYKTAYDQALMLPLLELSGDRSKYVSEILHVYNRSNPNNVDKIKQQEQYNTAQKIRAKKPYEKMK